MYFMDTNFPDMDMLADEIHDKSWKRVIMRNQDGWSRPSNEDDTAERHQLSI
jgi:hypothetical protein